MSSNKYTCTHVYRQRIAIMAGEFYSLYISFGHAKAKVTFKQGDFSYV